MRTLIKYLARSNANNKYAVKPFLATGNANNKYAVNKFSSSPAKRRGILIVRGIGMDIKQGCLYFITDDFFVTVNDPYLKINYEQAQRPHYFAIKEPATSLYWLVPCSSRVDKYKSIIQMRREQNKSTYGLKIIKIQGNKNALLFQDMFPIIEKYIQAPYIRGGQVVRISDPKVINDLESNAKTVISLLRGGTRFTPTQPDVLRIEQIMLAELNS